MLAMSQSFSMGSGSIEHNLRIKKGKGLRQNGCLERRFINEHMVVDEELIKDKKTYSEKLIEKIVAKEIGDRLYKINEKHLQQGHPNRVKTLKQWIENQMYDSKGKQRAIVNEYIVQIGDMWDATPYEKAVDENGNILDKNGKTIPLWDTRRRAGYKDGIITESQMSKKLKKVYRHFLKEFEKENPRARIVAASVHGDEASLHLHLSVCWIADRKNDVGISLAYTTALAQQYADKGIKTDNRKRNRNATTMWRDDMKKLLERVCLEHGIKRKIMHNKEKHKAIKPYQRFADARSEAFEKEFEKRDKELNQRENELNKKSMVLEERNANEKKIINKKQALLDRREAKLKEKESNINEKEKGLDNKEKLLNDKEVAIEADMQEVESIHKELKKEKEVIKKKQITLQNEREQVEKDKADIVVERNKLKALQTKYRSLLASVEEKEKRLERILNDFVNTYQSEGITGIAKYVVNEWTLLKQNHFDWFSVIHNENIALHEKKKKLNNLNTVEKEICR